MAFLLALWCSPAARVSLDARIYDDGGRTGRSSTRSSYIYILAGTLGQEGAQRVLSIYSTEHWDRKLLDALVCFWSLDRWTSRESSSKKRHPEIVAEVPAGTEGARRPMPTSNGGQKVLPSRWQHGTRYSAAVDKNESGKSARTWIEERIDFTSYDWVMGRWVNLVANPLYAARLIDVCGDER